MKPGRFPANVVLDDFATKFMDDQSGELISGQPSGIARKTPRNAYGKFNGGIPVTGYGDSGGASRFFYCAKPSPEERGNSKHPTIKPLALMDYLIKLICPIESGRIVLDPFAGSGTTCIAARKLEIDFMAFENDPTEWEEAQMRLQKELGLFY
jgi:site-specific DNA-methyltransferase (adenine-specific)